MSIIKPLITLLAILSLFLFPLASYASEVEYTVSYSKDSKYTDISLKNATLEIQLYTDGDAQGLETVTTNEAQAFTVNDKFGSLLTVDVLSIKGQPNHISCQGVGFRGKRDIEIDCQDRIPPPAL